MDVIFICSFERDTQKKRKREIEQLENSAMHRAMTKNQFHSNDLTKVGQSFDFCFRFLFLGLDVGHSRKSHFALAWECSECVANCEEIEFV